jgi:hypothetical protein
VLKGDNYRYPLVGKLIERWLEPKTPLAGDAAAALSTGSGLSIENSNNEEKPT